VAIITNVFKKMCASSGYSMKAFSSWATKQGILHGGKDGKASKVVKINQEPIRCYVLEVPDLENE
jgi:hypothetical protein